MINRKVYTVIGDLHGDTNDEEFPLKTLCDKCVKYYRIDSEQDLEAESCCDHCGL